MPDSNLVIGIDFGSDDAGFWRTFGNPISRAASTWVGTLGMLDAGDDGDKSHRACHYMFDMSGGPFAQDLTLGFPEDHMFELPQEHILDSGITHNFFHNDHVENNLLEASHTKHLILGDKLPPHNNLPTSARRARSQQRHKRPSIYHITPHQGSSWACHKRLLCDRKGDTLWDAVRQATSLTSAAMAAVALLSYHPGIDHTSHIGKAWCLGPAWWLDLRWTESNFWVSPATFAGAYAIYGLCTLHAIQSHQHHRHQNRFLLFGSLCGIALGFLKPHIPYLGVGEWISYLPATILVAVLLSLMCHFLVPSWRPDGMEGEGAIGKCRNKG
jgi:hypothetical protein